MIELDSGRIHVQRAKNGVNSTHPLTGVWNAQDAGLDFAVLRYCASVVPPLPPLRLRAARRAQGKAWNIAMKRLTVFCAITGLLLGEAAAQDRIERIDLTRFTCKQFLELNRDDALIVVGWLQGHYLDEHETPVVDFTKLSVESVSLANRCVARPDENVIAAADRVCLLAL